MSKLLKGDALAKGFDLPRPPKRNPIPEQVAEAFEQPNNVRSLPKKKRPVSRLRRDERGERVAVYIPPELAEQLRVRCARERRSVSDAMTEALAAWLKA